MELCHCTQLVNQPLSQALLRGSRKHLDAALPEAKAVTLQELERVEHGLDVQQQRFDRETMIFAFGSATAQYENAKVLRISRELGDRLSADDALAGDKMDRRAGTLSHSARAFEGHHVGRIGDHLGGPQR